jgi:hypothetical protein
LDCLPRLKAWRILISNGRISGEPTNQFAELTAGDFPDKAIFKEMGLGNIDPNAVFEQFIKSFKVSLNEAYC